MRQEVLDEKVLDKRDDLLRALLLDVLEREAALAQTNALVRLIERYLKRLGSSQPSISSTPSSSIEKLLPQSPVSPLNDENASTNNTEAHIMDVDEDASATKSDNKTSGHENTLAIDTTGEAVESARLQLQRSYRLLMERLDAVRDTQ